MESTEVIIARLVLGYLKHEKCKSAYKEFLRSSNHLQDDINLAKSKYLATRFVGLTLEDILSEYFEIYKMVQGRLESTNYYNECHSKTSLVQQLLYLLDKVLSSRTSTPCPRSPIDSTLDETSISHVDDHISDVETTPAHTLPGNIRCTSEDSYLHKTPRKKQQLEKSAPVNFPSPDKEDISEVLAQTLLENKEFHEKIAQTINKVAEKQYRVSSELDKTIKTVVKETEEDPIFDKILDEIIGSTSAIENCKGLETSSATTSAAKNANEIICNRPKRTYKNSNTTDEYDQSFMSRTISQNVEEQNNEAIRSIVANSKLGSDKHIDNPIEPGPGEVIVFDGSLDKYLIANTCNANTQTQPVQNPLYFNTSGGLLMVPSGITANVNENLQIDTSKPYFLVNKPSTINWNMPTPNITEQDILAMPTVIVNDQRQSICTAQSVLQTPVSQTVSKPATIQQIVPKPVIEIPNVQEYLSFQRSLDSYRKGLTKVLYPKKKKERKPSESSLHPSTSEAELPIAKTSTIEVRNDTDLSAIEVQNDTGTLPDDLHKDQKDPPSESNTHIESDEPKVPKAQSLKSEPQAVTPPVASISQKVTPKSSSHVRNLDFSSPPKITSTHKKTMKTKLDNKTPPFVHKKQAAKTLFKSSDTGKDESVKDGTESKHDQTKKSRKLVGNWDADLRAIIPAAEESDNRTPKRKRSATVKNVKKKVKKMNRVVNLNTTEHEAALLEAALQTPIKIRNENLQATERIADDIEVADHDVKENICEAESCEQELIDSESEYKNNSEAKKKHNSEVKTKNIKSGKTSKCKQTNKESRKNNDNKMVLSPSKLNANKRNLVSTDILTTNLTNSLTKVSTDDGNKFITPEMVKENVSYPIKANRNITSLLETPLKNDIIPKTPGQHTPSTLAMDLNMSMCSTGFTPFTKMLEANLKGIDINSMPTPSIPITPSFPPFTPNIDLISPYSNRPTDYSTSSSYYQPSDNEQNRSLEANVIELEKNSITIHSDVIVKDNILVASGSGISKEVIKYDHNKCTSSTTVKERLNIFNKNVIGKKNLNLMKRNISSSSSSSDDSTSESSSDDTICNGEQSNETVIFQKKAAEIPTRTYCLRNRNTSGTIKDETVNKTTDSKLNKNQSNKETKLNPKLKPTSNVNSKQGKERIATTVPEALKEQVNEKEITAKDEVSRKSVEINSCKQKFLKDLEEKRLRTINKFKNVEKSPPNKSTSKPLTRQSKFIKIKPIPNITTTRKPRKSVSPKKTPQSKMGNASKRKDEIKKSMISPICNNSNKCAEILDSSTSDVEAQNLIEGLKERGIHLMHNKVSPIKTLNTTFNESKAGNEKTEGSDNINSKNSFNCDKDNISKYVSPELKKNELSTSELESELRETYDTETFEEAYECVLFDESKKITKTFENYDTKVLAKTFIAKVFLEEVGAEVDVPLVFSPFYTLLDIQPSLDLQTRHAKVSYKTKDITKVTQPEITFIKKESVEKVDVNKYDIHLIRDVTNPEVSDETPKSDDDLMNYAIVGSGREETPERSESPKSTRKRKHQNEENSHTEKKCKTLLKKINVDSFLNNIHGES